MDLDNELIRLSGMNENQLRKELALWLYAKGKLSMGRAMKFARLNRFDFMQLMAQNNIPVNYDVSDFEDDLKTIENLKL